jgi:uncharacterized protein YkwD
MKIFFLIIGLTFGVPATVLASDYAGQVSAYRHAHGLSAVKLDGQLNTIAAQQARAMAASGTLSHTIGGDFSSRMGKLRASRAAENIAAGVTSFRDTLKQWENSAGHRENLLLAGARKIGIASAANPKSPYRIFWAMVITD